MTNRDPKLFGPEHNPEECVYHYVNHPSVQVLSYQEWPNEYGVTVNGMTFNAGIRYRADGCGTAYVEPNSFQITQLRAIEALIATHGEAIIRACRNFFEDHLSEQ